MPDNTFKAVSFAASMMKQGQWFNTAITIASRYYKVDRADVDAGIRARRSASTKKRAAPAFKPRRVCCICGEEATRRADAYDCSEVVHYWFTCDKHDGQAEPWVEDCDWRRFTKVKSVKYTPSKGDPDA